MTRFSDDVRYWTRWLVILVVLMIATRWYLVEPVVQAIRGLR